MSCGRRYEIYKVTFWNISSCHELVLSIDGECFHAYHTRKRERGWSSNSDLQGLVLSMETSHFACAQAKSGHLGQASEKEDGRDKLGLGSHKDFQYIQ
jgi:hypothetical protein